MIFGNEWDILLEDEMKKPYYQALRQFLVQEYRTTAVYPPQNEIFHALRRTTYSSVRCAILGQDPYHGTDARHEFFRAPGRGAAAVAPEHL